MFVWDVASGDQFRRFGGHSAKVNAVAFNADASILASGKRCTPDRCCLIIGLTHHALLCAQVRLIQASGCGISSKGCSS